MLFEPPPECGRRPSSCCAPSWAPVSPSCRAFASGSPSPVPAACAGRDGWMTSGFDIANHVRASGPAGARRRGGAARLGRRVLLPAARSGPAAVGDRPRRRLADGRWAMVSKTHHCMVDGVGSVDIGQTILDTEPDSRAPAAASAERSRQPPRHAAGDALAGRGSRRRPPSTRLSAARAARFGDRHRPRRRGRPRGGAGVAVHPPCAARRPGPSPSAGRRAGPRRVRRRRRRPASTSRSAQRAAWP